MRLNHADPVGPEGQGLHPGASPSLVSVLIPVLNEALTIGHLVRRLRRCPSVREVLVIDDGSIDRSGEIAARAGATVIVSSMLGKGASMEDGIAAAKAEYLLFLDGDLFDVCDDIVERMTAPLLSGEADVVKAGFSRTAGRVTMLTAKPLLSAFFPELTRFAQPLGGIVAARRSVLRNLHLENDYGVDIGLLIDATMRGARVQEVDIGHLEHQSQSLEALGEMAKQVTRVILDRAWRYERLGINPVRQMEEVDRLRKAEVLPARLTGEGRRRFALFDMDGVLLNGRFILELAERVGASHELERFLDNRSLPDEERTKAIAALFTGVHMDVFEETARSMPLMDGAIETIVSLRRAGYVVGLVTDSFHIAAETVRRRVFADFAVAHMLRFHNRLCTGQVTLSPAMTGQTGPAFGPTSKCVEHPCCKANVVRYLQNVAGMMPRWSLAVGDGENDICMLGRVGLPVAFQPRTPAVAAAAVCSLSGSLTGLLDVAGVKRVRRGRPPRRTSSETGLVLGAVMPEVAG